MESKLNNYLLNLEEPHKSTVLALVDVILKENKEISISIKYGMPFFTYKGKMFSYLWVHKKYKMPYIGFVEGKLFVEDYLLQEKRSRMKIYLVKNDEDFDLIVIKNLIQKAIRFYNKN